MARKRVKKTRKRKRAKQTVACGECGEETSETTRMIDMEWDDPPEQDDDVCRPCRDKWTTGEFLENVARNRRSRRLSRVLAEVSRRLRENGKGKKALAALRSKLEGSEGELARWEGKLGFT